MNVIDEGGLRFRFPKDWEVAKYDEWAYFQRFKSTCGGNKGIDLVAVDGSGQLWLTPLPGLSLQLTTPETTNE